MEFTNLATELTSENIKQALEEAFIKQLKYIVETGDMSKVNNVGVAATHGDQILVHATILFPVTL